MTKEAKICGKCEVSIYRNYLEMENNYYHPHCYKCKTCSKEMTEMATKRGYDLYCQKCSLNLKPVINVKSSLTCSTGGFSDCTRGSGFTPVKIIKSEPMNPPKKYYGTTYEKLETGRYIRKDINSLNVLPIEDNFSLANLVLGDKVEPMANVPVQNIQEDLEIDEDIHIEVPDLVTDIPNLTTSVPRPQGKVESTPSSPNLPIYQMACGECKKKINSRYIVLKVREEDDEQVFHYGCFRCFECNGNVEDNQEFAVMDTHFYHVSCLKD